MLDVIAQQFPEGLTALAAAVNDVNYLTIRELCHKLKSTASIIGADELVVSLEEMRTAAAATDIEKVQVMHQQITTISAIALKELAEEKTRIESTN